mgnify:CR=1 FL=1
MAGTRDDVIDDATVTERLARELPAWRLEDGWIRRTYKTAGWKSTLMVINTVGHLAEAAWAAYDDLAARYDVVVAEEGEQRLLLVRVERQAAIGRPGGEPLEELVGTGADGHGERICHPPIVPAW